MDENFKSDILRYGYVLADYDNLYDKEKHPIRIKVIHYKEHVYSCKMNCGNVEIKDITYAHNYKIGQKIEFKQEGMEQLLHGKIIELQPTYVTVKCKNGQKRFPGIDDIIRICEN